MQLSLLSLMVTSVSLQLDAAVPSQRQLLLRISVQKEEKNSVWLMISAENRFHVKLQKAVLIPRLDKRTFFFSFFRTSQRQSRPEAGDDLPLCL